MSAAQAVTPDLLREMPLPRPEPGGDKEGRGRVLVVAGSVDVPGAALLAGEAALRAGAGKLQIATCRPVAAQLGAALPEALVAGYPETQEGGIDPACADLLIARAEKSEAVLIGPGMGDRDAVAALATALLAGVDGPGFVVDAAALTCCQDRPEVLRRQAGRIVLTPHAGEMAAFLDRDRDEISADPLLAARQAAARTQAVVVMKGACTRIVSPQGEAWTCDHGNVGLATSGSGDTLAGIIAGLLARGATPLAAAIWGVYLHGEAGERLARSVGAIGYLAREIPPEIPRIMSALAGSGVG
jgi:hydroxyethylthiazole kinase-like uncharacterized protein yjeF